MSNADDTPTKIIAQTKYLQLVERDRWSFVQRTTDSRAVCVVARTNDNHVILIEQFRPPVGKKVIELPAGLVGDLADQADESLQQAAGRELMEETGYEAGHWQEVVTLASCPGLTDELSVMFLASELQKKGDGGGDDSENILVHQIPLPQVHQWLIAQSQAGKLIDARVFTGLYLLNNVSKESNQKK